MIIWSIHELDFFRKLEKNKVILPNKNLLTWKDEFLESYYWLADQMEKRIGGRPRPNSLPFWGWYQWQNSKQKKPDLRSRSHLMPGKQGVRLELEIPDEEVVLTDFSLWNDVLNKAYIPSSEEDYLNFYKYLDDRKLFSFGNWTKKHKRLAEKSWERIFDLSFYVKDFFSYPKHKKSIQATFWKISMSQVKDVTFFTAREHASLYTKKKKQ